MAEEDAVFFGDSLPEKQQLSALKKRNERFYVLTQKKTGDHWFTSYSRPGNVDGKFSV